jgi:ribosomal protein L6P/L9E
MFYKNFKDKLIFSPLVRNKLMISNQPNNSLIKINFFYQISKNNVNFYSYNNFKNFIKNLQFVKRYFLSIIYLVGLGYKNFVYNNYLYILIGDSNYILFTIPREIKLFCKKNQIFGLSVDKQILNNFFSKLQYLKKINYYKGKGILKFRNFKFMKLKIGKKQKV